MGLLLVLLLTQAAPSELAIHGFKMHVEISEDLDPDAVRALAKPGITLWVTTRSNVLKQSLVENLARASEAFVQMRAPLKRSHLEQLRQGPRVGLWLTEQPTGVLGPRPIAISIDGPLLDVRAQRVIWTPDSTPSLEEWSRFSAMPGAKLVKLTAEIGCVPGFPKSLVVFRRTPDLPDCQFPSRVRVSPAIAKETLIQLFAKDPSVELDVLVGADDRSALQATALRATLAQAAGLK
ncbi:MAG: hypothetical protein ACT4TC_24110 [Myxococcaceae bacterium]